jgi:hypothetical protein
MADDLRATAAPRQAANPVGAYSSTPAELKERIAAERAGCPFVVYRDENGAQRLVVLAADGADARVSIGRRSSCDISLAWDSEVSRLHAELESAGVEWTIVDDGLSRNGTFVNGARLRGRRRLDGGDLIRVGGTALAYWAPSHQSSDATFESSDYPTLDDLTQAEQRVLVALCRPFKDAVRFATPANNQQIADELVVSVDTVKTHMRMLFRKLGVDDAPQAQKRQLLVERAFKAGLVDERQL